MDDCSRLKLTRVAVPEAAADLPLWVVQVRQKRSCGRVPPAARALSELMGVCVLIAFTAIGRCNATHGVEYAHRLPSDGEPQSFPSSIHLRIMCVMRTAMKARPRLYLEFEPPVHARVNQV